MGTVGALDAMITWSADGMRQSIQEAIPLLRGLVTGVQTNPDDGTIKLRGNLGSVTTKPQVTDGLVALQVVDVTGLGLLLPSEMVQSALDAFTTRLTENYPLGIHADSVQITYDGVTAHYSTRDMSIPQGNQGKGQPREQGQPGPLLRKPIGRASMARAAGHHFPLGGDPTPFGFVTSFADRGHGAPFRCGDYVNGEFERGQQIDQFVECEFVDVRLEQLGHLRAGQVKKGSCLSRGQALLCDAPGDGGDQRAAC